MSVTLALMKRYGIEPTLDNYIRMNEIAIEKLVDFEEVLD